MRKTLFFSTLSAFGFAARYGWAQAVQDIRDVKPPSALPLNWVAIVLALLALVLLGGVFWFWQRQRFAREKTPPPVILPPPWETARRKLKELFAENLPGKGQIKEYYSRLSDIVRQYMEDRFDLRAPEMTTEEFLFSLRTSSQLNPAQKEALKDFLTCCDMVKFAKYPSHAQEMVHSFVLAERLIDETSPKTYPAVSSDSERKEDA